MTKEPRLNRERTIFSINGAGKTGQPHAKEWNRTCFTLCIKITSKWIKGLNITPETIQFLEENIGGKLLDIGLGDYCLGLTAKAKTTEAKINK